MKMRETTKKKVFKKMAGGRSLHMTLELTLKQALVDGEERNRVRVYENRTRDDFEKWGSQDGGLPDAEIILTQGWGEDEPTVKMSTGGIGNLTLEQGQAFAKKYQDAIRIATELQALIEKTTREALVAIESEDWTEAD